MLYLNSGDIFNTITNKNILQKGINFIQGALAKLRGRDGKSESSHTGIILDREGTTFESNFLKIGKYHLNDYAGKRVRIYRYDDMTIRKFNQGFDAVKKHEDQIYPVHRLLFFIVPGLAERFAPLPKPVCSELVAKFLFCAGVRGKAYWGTDVDELEDEYRDNPRVHCIFDGKLPKSFKELK